MIEPLDQSCEIADAVAVAVLVRGDVQAVDDGVLVPEIEQSSRPQLRLTRYAKDVSAVR
ncbi:hypothetical protein [Bradyrhizobium canariense]|uniref:hypothetical protein n=1 Tax=Bradyrhizobium canariense TaxID=255045 RepID=UPI0028982E48|nr:hypothetical protein [Bradyrhizobium canariense]